MRDGEVVVADHGPGIAEEDLPRVFDRFYRAATARSKPGAGLGLAIVREAAEAHGGRATVESSPAGARFRLVLPASLRARTSGGGCRLRVPAPALDHAVDPRLDGGQDLRLTVARDSASRDVGIEVPLEVGEERILEPPNGATLLERHLPEGSSARQPRAELGLVEVEVGRGGCDRAAVHGSGGVLVLQGHRFAPFVGLHHQAPKHTCGDEERPERRPRNAQENRRLTCD